MNLEKYKHLFQGKMGWKKNNFPQPGLNLKKIDN